jgi:hypothetical protein
VQTQQHAHDHALAAQGHRRSKAQQAAFWNPTPPCGWPAPPDVITSRLRRRPDPQREVFGEISTFEEAIARFVTGLGHLLTR